MTPATTTSTSRPATRPASDGCDGAGRSPQPRAGRTPAPRRRPPRFVRAARAAPTARHRHDHRDGTGGAARRPRSGRGRRPGDRHLGQRGARRVPRHAVDRHGHHRRGHRRTRPVGVVGRRDRHRQRPRRQRRRGRPGSRDDPRRGSQRVVVVATLPDSDAHAGRTETSLLLAIDPASSICGAGAGRSSARRHRPRAATPRVFAVSPSGVLGDPTGATLEEGRDLLDKLTGDLVAAVDDARNTW